MVDQIVSSRICFCCTLFLFALTANVSAQDLSSKAELLDALSQQDNVDVRVVQALRVTDQVRVYVGVRRLNGSGLTENGGSQERSNSSIQKDIAETRTAILSAVPDGSFELKRQFKNLPGFAGLASAQAVAALSRQLSVWRVDLDEGGSGGSGQAQALAKIDQVKLLGFRGAGMLVAVVDSGYDTDHVDLADSLAGEQCFCSGGNCCPNGQATQSGSGAAEDDNGHGTNVSGIITSNGVIAPEGSAPEAGIVAVKVLDSNNSFCCSSDVIAAMDWIISERPDVDVVNMSLGTNARFAGDCDAATSWAADWAAAINTLKTMGIPVMVSSGNNGSGLDMQVPACIKNAISVGAVYDSNVGSVSVLGCTDNTTAADQVTCFSNSSTTTDIFAPGAPYTSTGRGGGTSTYYGTSQASPTVAACAALLLQESPDIDVDQLQAALIRSTTLVTDSTNGLSFPRLNCLMSLEGVFDDGFEQIN